MCRSCGPEWGRWLSLPEVNHLVAAEPTPGLIRRRRVSSDFHSSRRQRPWLFKYHKHISQHHRVAAAEALRGRRGDVVVHAREAGKGRVAPGPVKFRTEELSKALIRTGPRAAEQRRAPERRPRHRRRQLSTV